MIQIPGVYPKAHVSLGRALIMLVILITIVIIANMITSIVTMTIVTCCYFQGHPGACLGLPQPKSLMGEHPCVRTHAKKHTRRVCVAARSSNLS